MHPCMVPSKYILGENSWCYLNDVRSYDRFEKCVAFVIDFKLIQSFKLQIKNIL